MKHWIAMVVLAAGALQAQESAPTWKQRVFDVKHIDPRPMASLIGDMRVRNDTRVNANVDLKVVSIGTYEDRLIPLAEELIKKYDVPGSAGPSRERRNVELVVHLILAAPKGTAGSMLPGDLDSVAKQLKAVFGYGDLRLLDTVLLRNREGEGGATEGNPGRISEEVPDAAQARYQMNYKSSSLGSIDRATVVRIDNFRFGMRIPYLVGPLREGVAPQFQFQEITLSTNLDIREGQKVVVAKNKIDNSDKALILVLSAKAVD